MEGTVLPSEVLVAFEGQREMYSPTVKILGAIPALMLLWFMSIETMRYALRRRDEYLRQLRPTREVAGIWATNIVFGAATMVPCLFTLTWLFLQGLYASIGAVGAIAGSTAIWFANVWSGMKTLPSFRKVPQATVFTFCRSRVLFSPWLSTVPTVSRFACSRCRSATRDWTACPWAAI